MMPALLTSTSTLSTVSANSRTEARFCRSSLRTSTCPPVMVSAAAVPFSRLRTATVTLAPTRASSRAVTRPSPLLAPVTITLRPVNEGRSALVHPLMPTTLRSLLGDVEACDDRLDVRSLCRSLVGVGRHGQLHEVTLRRLQPVVRDHDTVVGLHALAVEVVAALD